MVATWPSSNCPLRHNHDPMAAVKTQKRMRIVLAPLSIEYIQCSNCDCHTTEYVVSSRANSVRPAHDRKWKILTYQSEAMARSFWGFSCRTPSTQAVSAAPAADNTHTKGPKYQRNNTSHALSEHESTGNDYQPNIRGILRISSAIYMIQDSTE